MTIFVSEAGNAEVWASRDLAEQGGKKYYTLEEWAAAHPAPEPPEPTEEQKKQRRAQEIRMELTQIDNTGARAARAIALAYARSETPTPEDVARLTELETQAEALRQELAGLEGEQETSDAGEPAPQDAAG